MSDWRIASAAGDRYNIVRAALVWDGSSASHDLFQAALTVLDPEVALTLAWAGSGGAPPSLVQESMEHDRQWAQHLKRAVSESIVEGDLGAGVVALAQDRQFDLILLPLTEQPWPAWVDHVLSHATCRVLLAPPARMPAVTDVAE